MYSVVSQSCDREGATEIIGIESLSLIAGRLEICVGGEWHGVYDRGWGEPDVRLICGERGFPPNSESTAIFVFKLHVVLLLTTDAAFCTDSCLGASNRSTGYSMFSCSEASQFSDCSREFIDAPQPLNNAGVLCGKSFHDDYSN